MQKYLEFECCPHIFFLLQLTIGLTATQMSRTKDEMRILLIQLTNRMNVRGDNVMGEVELVQFVVHSIMILIMKCRDNKIAVGAILTNSLVIRCEPK